jgi:alpha-L-fucosidase
VEIVAKGGSLLLGVGPAADGTFNQNQIDRLKEIGDWLKQNGSAIYSTRTADFYNSANTFFTKSKAGEINAIYCLPENATVPKVIEWQGNVPKKGTIVKFLSTNEKVKWEADKDHVKVYLPKSFNKYTPALAFSYVSQD